MTIKTLLVGINAYQKGPLSGCLNDVERMRDLLTRRYGISDDHMRILTDSGATNAAIVEGLRWLTQPDEGENNPVRLFYFSGHGTQQVEPEGDEEDGFDECLVPYDAETAGLITDDTRYEIYKDFAPDGHLLLVLDCCHSGGSQRDTSDTILYRVLPRSEEEEQQFEEGVQAAKERYGQKREQFIEERLMGEREPWQRDLTDAELRVVLGRQFDKDHRKPEIAGDNIVLLSACLPEQRALETDFSGLRNGVFTYYLTSALDSSGGQLTYRALIEKVQEDMLAAEGITQEPRCEGKPSLRDRQFLYNPAS